jgi:hypothetical protein
MSNPKAHVTPSFSIPTEALGFWPQIAFAEALLQGTIDM